MTITLTTDQQNWIRDHIASGEFASEEDAVRALIDESIISRAHDEEDDFEWAIPLIEEGIASAERGDLITLEESRRRIDALLASMSG
jgi:Arc/MetJ-type ribon-helix-helix transcriptional regulator